MTAFCAQCQERVETVRYGSDDLTRPYWLDGRTDEAVFNGGSRVALGVDACGRCDCAVVDVQAEVVRINAHRAAATARKAIENDIFRRMG